MNRSLRLALFVVVALVQLAVAGSAIVKSELALRTGEAFRFRIQPVDPVDAFRGRYVAIRFAVERAPAADDLEVRSGKHVFVPLEVDADGYAALGRAEVDPPSTGSYLRLRAGVVSPDEEGNRWVWVTLPFRRYYMDEERAPAAERAVWGGRRGQREASISVRVRNGVGVIEELYIDDVPIHQWLVENAQNR
ncbi:MAG: GDYXXLXY domain-containing protein [Thermoanaerobaculales bacterium]|nr:GDYXXLXY domain-containing protein [Thermoanaerobaculales bacterium]